MGRRMAALPKREVNRACDISRSLVDSSNCESPGAVNKGLVEYQTLAPSAMRTTLTINMFTT